MDARPYIFMRRLPPVAGQETPGINQPPARGRWAVPMLCEKGKPPMPAIVDIGSLKIVNALFHGLQAGD